jgi:nicotinamide riboside kinase
MEPQKGFLITFIPRTSVEQRCWERERMNLIRTITAKSNLSDDDLRSIDETVKQQEKILSDKMLDFERLQNMIITI